MKTEKERVNELLKGMGATLGMEIIQWDKGLIQATMPVTEKNCQLYGLLNGGASLAAAETLAGVGSGLLCSKEYVPVGIQVSGNHINMAHVGDRVTITAILEHQGRMQHVWNVEVKNEHGDIISIERVVNLIVDIKETERRGKDV